jgi:hypothetical protein
MEKQPIRLSAHGYATTDPSVTFTRIVAIDLTTVFTGHGVLPAVVEVTNGHREWTGTGAVRAVTFSDRGEVLERLTGYEPAARYAYEATNFTNVLRFLVSGARSEWSFRPDLKGGTVIEWDYTFHPLPGRTGIVRALLAKPWKRYMEEILLRTVTQIEEGTVRAS